MFSKFSYLGRCFVSSLLKTGTQSHVKFNNSLRGFYLSQSDFILDDRKLLKSIVKKDEGTEGETAINIDSVVITSSRDMFPVEDTPNQLFNGIPFKEIPIINIKVSKNNTILALTDPSSGVVRLARSCGMEGFKNTRKGTNVAAQATAVTFGTNAISKGYSTIRVRVRGLGPGRMSAIKGLQMAGLKIISVTDFTPVSWNPPRPRKQRRL